ncbi:MAG: hypothetical protein AABY32_01470 [Nanoarchaeota archaeon]
MIIKCQKFMQMKLKKALESIYDLGYQEGDSDGYRLGYLEGKGGFPDRHKIYVTGYI